MTRKLPWAQQPFPSEDVPKTTPRKRRQRPDTLPKTSPQVGSDRGWSHVQTTLVTPIKKRAASRTPSTSPPPTPPELEPMREGYDEDDEWMIVEDEFQTLAQSFTKYLHHAEYKRLMRKARDAPKTQLPEPKSPMSKETKQRLRRKALEKRQSDGLEEIMPTVPGSNEDRIEDEKIEDPWRGTSLAGLMATGSQEKRSLKGLGKVPSSTRAAKGYKNVENSENLDSHDGTPRETSFLKSGARAMASNAAAAKDAKASSTRQHPVESGVKNPPAGSRLSLTSGSKISMSRRATTASVGRVQQLVSPPAEKPSPPRSVRKMEKKRKLKEESREERLASVPMFLF